jgi:hypothetical protein
MATIKPLNDGIKTELRILPGNAVNGIFRIRAPHYLALFSEEKEGHLTNAGFILQQMDLYLSAIGVGSCWLALAKPSKEYLKSSELKYVINLAFGRPSEPLHRTGSEDFNRLPLDRIRDAKGVDDLLESARLAPSASNSQRWFFTGGGGRVNVYVAKATLLNRWNLLDAGIAISHIWIAANHRGKRIEAVMEQEATRNPPHGKLYVATLKVS